ncbi:MAG: ABC transporter ATP-binding protein [Raineya sp.]
MSDIVLLVENLWKQYRLGIVGANSLREDVNRWLAKLRGKEDPRLKVGETNDRENLQGQYVWALQDINFEVKQGEVLGIIGRNGAGKSTLLKILSKITAPTKGIIKTKGRIASLLEVGTGFHPELTGRENIFLNGAILGMTKNDIRKKFDEIVEFSGIGKYIDTPVKRYSSGMYVRLAFAVAAHLEPEILIIDEVLAVGDAEFQKKCLGKMKDVSGEGRTVLFVSHNMTAVQSLCNNGLVMKNGQLAYSGGNIQEVVSYYLKSNHENKPEYVGNIEGHKPQIVRARVNTSEKNQLQRNGSPMSIEFWLYTPEPITGVSLSFIIKDSYDNNIVHLWIFDSEKPICRSKGITHLKCKINHLRLYMGNYTISTFLGNAKDNIIYQNLEGICNFEVLMNKYRSEYEWQPNTCKYIEECEWDILES